MARLQKTVWARAFIHMLSSEALSLGDLETSQFSSSLGFRAGYGFRVFEAPGEFHWAVLIMARTKSEVLKARPGRAFRVLIFLALFRRDRDQSWAGLLATLNPKPCSGPSTLPRRMPALPGSRHSDQATCQHTFTRSCPALKP